MIRTQINLEEEQHRLLTLEARRQRRSLSDLIRESINKDLKKKKKTNAGALFELAQKAVNFKKINPSVPDDLSEHHDTYLYVKHPRGKK